MTDDYRGGFYDDCGPDADDGNGTSGDAFDEEDAYEEDAHGEDDGLDFLVGRRLTTIQTRSDGMWPAELDEDVVLLVQALWLPTGQQPEVETDFLASHLPYHRATIGGFDDEGDTWLLSVQMVPRAYVARSHGPDADPAGVMRDAMDSALQLNAGAWVAHEFVWKREDLLTEYLQRSVSPSEVAGWTCAELLKGRLASLTGTELSDIVERYPSGCAYPGEPHECERDVFNDVFAHGWGRHD